MKVVLKTLDIAKFKEYIQKKIEINSILYPFYEKTIFRKLKLQGYRQTKKSEQKLMNNFEKKFGSPEKVVVCFGDYEQKKHMKFKEPSMGKGMRTLFRKAGYKTYLVDEFRTSCMCSKCGCQPSALTSLGEGRCEKFMTIENPRPYRKGKILVHGLLRCKNGCGYWNRDTNGATNIYKIASHAVNKIDRPFYLCRSKATSQTIMNPDTRVLVKNSH